MKDNGLEISECNSSEKLMELYNIWSFETGFMSTGNCEHKTWKDLIEYGKENKTESIDFALEYLNDIGSNWIILTFIDWVIGNPIDDGYNGYLQPQAEYIRQIYIAYLTMLKEGKYESKGSN